MGRFIFIECQSARQPAVDQKLRSLTIGQLIGRNNRGMGSKGSKWKYQGPKIMQHTPDMMGHVPYI